MWTQVLMKCQSAACLQTRARGDASSTGPLTQHTWLITFIYCYRNDWHMKGVSEAEITHNQSKSAQDCQSVTPANQRLWFRAQWPPSWCLCVQIRDSSRWQQSPHQPLWRNPALYLCAHTHTHTTHTHTQVCFCELWGHSIGVMVFILYKLYILLPYTSGSQPFSTRGPHNQTHMFARPTAKKITDPAIVGLIT